MVATRNNANNDRIAKESTTMIQVLQAQIEELRQKGIADQLHHEEDRRKQEEDWRRQVEEVSLLREQNRKLLKQLGGPEQEEYSRTLFPSHTHQSRAVVKTLKFVTEFEGSPVNHPNRPSWREIGKTLHHTALLVMYRVI